MPDMRRRAPLRRVLAPDQGAGGWPAGPFLSCRPGSFGKAEPQAFAHLAEFGVRFVEVALPAAGAPAAALQADLARHGLRASSLQVPIDLGSATVEADMETAARRAREEFGARYIFTSAHAGKRDREACYEALRRAGDAAGRHDVTIVLETHPDLGTNGTVAAATMRAVGHPHVRVNWDPANVYFYNENCDGRREFDVALPYVGAVHLKDTGGGYRAWDFGELGTGAVDFAHILRRLVETGFAGPCTMEIEGVRGEDLTPEAAALRVRRSVDYIRGLGYLKG
jgi:sugar phosphate isomerase/epimerase